MNIGGNNIQPQNVTAKEASKMGTLAVPIAIDLTAQSAFALDLTPLQNERKFISVQCIYADNSANAAAFSITMADTGQTVTWPAGSQGYINVISTNNIKFVATSTGGVIIKTQFLNYDQGTRIWQPTTSGGTSGNVVVTNVPLPVQGTVSVGNFPATQLVSGSVAVTNFPSTYSVTGTVAVSNFPATQSVSGSVTVSGSVSVSNFPATQPVSIASTINVNNVVPNGFSTYLSISGGLTTLGALILWNPTGSGKTLKVTSVRVTDAVLAGNESYVIKAMTTLPSGTTSSGGNHTIGGANSVALVYMTTVASPITGIILSGTYVANGATATLQFDSPLVCAAGTGVMVATTNPNTFAVVQFDWQEA